ncbi:MAG: NAD-dependent epimerase/dehydratase family protein [Bryobacteraceae bacterium]
MLPARDLDHIIEHTGGVWESLAGQRIFLTGGTGFVGTWLCESLLRAGRGISAVVLTRSLDRFPFDHPAMQPLQGDVRTFAFPVGEFPYVIHAATPASTDDLDCEATSRVLEFARTHGTQRLLFTSSGAVYGRQPPQMTHVPEDFRGSPDTPYGQAKLAAERLFANSNSVIARLFAFSGPGLPLDKNFAVGNFVRDALTGGPIRIQGDGTPHRSYLYAADLAIWLWTLLVRGEPGRPYNVGSGRAVTIAELANIVAQVTTPGTPVEVAQTPVLGATPMRYVP